MGHAYISSVNVLTLSSILCFPCAGTQFCLVPRFALLLVIISVLFISSGVPKAISCLSLALPDLCSPALAPTLSCLDTFCSQSMLFASTVLLCTASFCWGKIGTSFCTEQLFLATFYKKNMVLQR